MRHILGWLVLNPHSTSTYENGSVISITQMRKLRPREMALITQLMNCKGERGIQLWTLFTPQPCLPGFNLYLDCMCLPGAARACGSVGEKTVFTKWLFSSMPRGRLHHKTKTAFHRWMEALGPFLLFFPLLYILPKSPYSSFHYWRWGPTKKKKNRLSGKCYIVFSHVFVEVSTT